MNISNLKKKFTSLRVGKAVFFLLGVAAVWVSAVAWLMSSSEQAKYDVHIQPGAVVYGTHSSAVIPLPTSAMHHSVAPMISGNTIRSYAHAGHASQLQTAATGIIRTTAIGSGAVRTSSGGGGGSASMGQSSARRAAANTQSSGFTIGAVPVPTMAMVSRSYATEAGFMGASTTADESLSDKSSLGGKKDDPTPANPGTPGAGGQMIPVGATPWLLMLLLAGAYGVRKRSRPSAFRKGLTAFNKGITSI